METDITFTRAEVDSQELGSDDEHMVTWIFFNVRVGEKDWKCNQWIDVKQPVGSSYEDGPLEFAGSSAPFGVAPLTEAAEKYYKSLFGKDGELFEISEDSKNVRVQDVGLRSQFNTTVEIPERSLTAGW